MISISKNVYSHNLGDIVNEQLMGLIANLLQYRGLVGILNNRNFCAQFKISHFTYSSDNNNNNNSLATGLLILSNKIALVLLLPN